MKLTIQIILMAGVMVGIIILLLAVGFSDWIGTSKEKYETLQAKPWRPFARLAFAFIMISLTCILGGALIRVSFRDR
jgi:hypothetical protein